VETWPSGHGIVRCHDSRFGATELNPGLGRGRFHPFRDSLGAVVPTLYGASSLDGSLAESVWVRLFWNGCFGGRASPVDECRKPQGAV